MKFELNYDKIRKKAEEIVSKLPDDNRMNFSGDLEDLIHELQVSHIELELQNEELHKTRDLLEKTLETYTGMFNNVPVGNLIVDKNGIILIVNDFFCRQTGCTYEMVRGKSLAEFINPSEVQQFHSRFSIFFNSPEGKTLELQLNCKNESSREVLISGQEFTNSLILPPEYTVGPFLWLTITDVTEAKHYLRKLEKSERKYRTLAENTSDVIWVYNVSGNYFVYVSPSVLPLRGYTYDEVMQQKFHELLVPEEVPLITRMIANGLEDFLSGPGMKEPFTIEIKMKCKDGSYVWTETTARMTYNEEGEVEVVGVSRNIEKRKQLEEELKRASHVINQSSLGMMVTDPQGIIQFVNPMISTITGYSSEEMIGKSAEMFRSPNAPANDEMWEEINKGNSWQGVFLNQRKNGIEYWESARIDSVFDYLGRITNYVSVKEDVTYKIAQENELRQVNLKLEAANARAHDMAVKAQEANMAKTTFLANMTHEIRTPLNAVIGFSQLIERQPGLTGTVRDYNSKIMRSGEHLLSLINDVLELSRIESGRYDLQESNVDLQELIHDILSVYSDTARQKRLQLRYRPDLSVPQFILADEIKLRRVIINLLSNAIKFTNQGHVELIVELKINSKGARYLYFAICDTGSGIAEHELGKLFNRFEQTHSGLNKSNGSGLGLSLVYELVKLMGGEVSVKSKLNEGSEFSFYLPYKKGQSVGINSTLSRRIKRIIAHESKNYRILVADDSEENRILVTEMLKSVGFEAEGVANGKLMLEKCRTGLPDLILMDLYMPVMDGTKALEQLQTEYKGKSLPVIAMSASIGENEREQTLSKGFGGYLLKPFRMDDLLRLVGGVLNIEYELESSPEDDGVAGMNLPDEELVMQWIADLDPKLKSEMLNALKVADLDTFLRLIGKLNTYQHRLREYLRELASDYDYSRIVKILSQQPGN